MWWFILSVLLLWIVYAYLDAKCKQCEGLLNSFPSQC